ncbi:MAG TPA: DUF1638 domain-containing protein [Patescibacteria group bacterium]|nr:DUF1638 domain-containing protein [Patescibacteria group bacterium]
MRTVILACQTLQDELKLAIQRTGCEYPVLYVESGLHNTPELLHKRIQEEVDRLDNVDLILLVFGYCGNSLLGIRSQQAKMVIARVDDCIPLLLGSAEERRQISKEMGTYFITKGWLDYENNIIREYRRCVERYGEGRAARVMKIMLGHYQRFLLIDTGAYPVETIAEQVKDFAEKMGMSHEIYNGSTRLLEKLLIGPWDDEFIVLEPGEELAMQDICASGEGVTGVSQLLASSFR